MELNNLEKQKNKLQKQMENLEMYSIFNYYKIITLILLILWNKLNLVISIQSLMFYHYLEQLKYLVKYNAKLDIFEYIPL